MRTRGLFSADSRNDMKMMMRKTWMMALAAGICVAALHRPAQAYIEAAYSLGKLVGDSTNIVLIKVESVDRQSNTIVCRKVEDVKGKHPVDVIKYNIAHSGFNAREWQNVMAWAV